jgi:hypothetical protein
MANPFENSEHWPALQQANADYNTAVQTHGANSAEAAAARKALTAAARQLAAASGMRACF